MKKLVLFLLFAICSTVAFTQSNVSDWSQLSVNDYFKEFNVVGLNNPYQYFYFKSTKNEDETHKVTFYRGGDATYTMTVSGVNYDPNGYGLNCGKTVLLLMNNDVTMFELPTSLNGYTTKSAQVFGRGVYLITVDGEFLVKKVYKSDDSQLFMDWLKVYSERKSEKYLSVGFFKQFKGFTPKSINMNTIVYPDGSEVKRRSGLLFSNNDGSNFMIVKEVPTNLIYYPDRYSVFELKSHPDLGNIVLLSVFEKTEVASITTRNAKVVDYKVIGKLEMGTYAIPLDNKGCNKDFFRVNLSGNELKYWNFQLENCTLSPNIKKELSTELDFR